MKSQSITKEILLTGKMELRATIQDIDTFCKK